MSKKWFGALVLALALVWGATAMAQVDGNACGGDGWKHALTFPFFSAIAPGYWNGLALINTGDKNIPREDVCFVGYTQEGDFLVRRGGSMRNFVVGPNKDKGIPANGMFVTLVDQIHPTNLDYQNTLWLAVFTNANGSNDQGAAAHTSPLHGFAMIGQVDGNGTQGYMALNTSFDKDELAGANVLSFDYIPESLADGWWTGIAIANNEGKDIGLKFEVYYEYPPEAEDAEGAADEKPYTFYKALNTNSMFVGIWADLDEDIDNTRRARVVVTTTDKPEFDEEGELENDPKDQQYHIHGFAYISDNSVAQGYLPFYLSNE